MTKLEFDQALRILQTNEVSLSGGYMQVSYRDYVALVRSVPSSVQDSRGFATLDVITPAGNFRIEPTSNVRVGYATLLDSERKTTYVVDFRDEVIVTSVKPGGLDLTGAINPLFLERAKQAEWNF